MLATTARARVGARGGARVRYAGPVADGNNGMRPARPASCCDRTVCSHAVGCDNEIVVRTVKGVMMLRIPTLHSIVQLYPTLHSTVAVFTASFSRGKKKRALGHVWSALQHRGACALHSTRRASTSCSLSCSPRTPTFETTRRPTFRWSPSRPRSRAAGRAACNALQAARQLSGVVGGGGGTRARSSPGA